MKVKHVFPLIVCLFVLLQGCSPDTEPEIKPQIDKAVQPVWAIQPTYTDAARFASGLAYVKTASGEAYFINTQGERALSIPYDNIASRYPFDMPMMNFGVVIGYDDESEQHLLLRSGLTVPFTQPGGWDVDPVTTVNDSLRPAKCSDVELGYFNQQNLWYIEPKYVTVHPFRDDVSMARLNNGGDYLVYSDGEVAPLKSVLPYKGEGYLTKYGKDYSIIYMNQKDYFIDSKGEIAFAMYFEEARSFSEGYAAVKQDGLWGFIDSNGEWITKPIFKEVFDFNEGMAKVVDEKDREAFINTSGEIVIPFQRTEYGYHRFISGITSKRNWSSEGIVNMEGKWLVKPKYDFIGINDHFAVLEKGDSKYIYFINQNKLLETAFSSVEKLSPGLLVAETGERQYIVNTEDATISEEGFVWIEAMSEGLALVHNNGVGFIDSAGSWIITPQFEDAMPFSNGLAAVKKDGKWGYIANPLIYGNWSVDEYERGISLSLFSESSETNAPADFESSISDVKTLVKKLTNEDISTESIINELSSMGINAGNGRVLTREDASCLLAYAARCSGKNTYCLLAFLSDEAEVAEQKLSSVSYAACMGLFNFNQPGVFQPNETVTTAEFCTAIVRLYESCL